MPLGEVLHISAMVCAQKEGLEDPTGDYTFGTHCLRQPVCVCAISLLITGIWILIFESLVVSPPTLISKGWQLCLPCPLQCPQGLAQCWFVMGLCISLFKLEVAVLWQWISMPVCWWCPCLAPCGSQALFSSTLSVSLFPTNYSLCV